MTDSNHNTIVNNVSYNAANQLLTMNYPAANETRSYNVLNQLTNVTAGSGENLTYNYPTNGTNNGKVSSMYNAVSGETVTYTYDSLNRLLTANSNAGWGQQYGFDGFGNLLSKTVTAGSGPSLSQTVNPANNQISGLYGGYDANGNTADTYTNGQYYALSYDAENRISSMGYSGGQTLASYAYDTQNRRIWSWPSTLDTWGNATGYTVNVYTPGGQKLAAYTVAPVVYPNNGQTIPYMAVGLATSDQYFGGRRLASMDQLGSVGNYFPWGEDKGGTSPQNNWNFATYWRDSVSGLDYANNRYYSNAYGRFMTPDPYTNSGRSSDPQGWNRYAYTGGDPVNRTDGRGTDWDDCGDGWETDASLSGPCGWSGDGFVTVPLTDKAPPTQSQVVSIFRQAVSAAAAAWLLTNESRMSSSASIPTYLAMKSECWLPDSGPGNLQSASYTLFITYQILNQNGQPMSGPGLSGVSISEDFLVLQGDLSPGPPWQYGTSTGIQEDGTFTDVLSSNSIPGFPNYISALQTFTASGTIAGVPFYQPLQIMGFGPTTSALHNFFNPTNVTVNGNGLGTNPATECPH